MEIQDFTEEYQSKTDEELLRLAVHIADLTPEANLALNNELSRRRIDSVEHLLPFQEDEKRRKEEAAKHPGPLFLIHPFGIGHLRLGKADRVSDPATGLEQFRTTMFVMLFWFPIVPTGTFLIKKKRSFLSKRFTVVKRLPLDWRQVRRVWRVAVGILFATLIAVGLLLYFS